MSTEIPVAPAGAVRGTPRLLLRGEALAVLSGAVLAYGQCGWNWWLFAVLFLAPDLGMLGYLRSPALGAVLYNAAHTLVGPALVLGWGVWAGEGTPQAVSLVWIAHIAFDRVLGYGLKYPGAFHATHLGDLRRVGRGRPDAAT